MDRISAVSSRRASPVWRRAIFSSLLGALALTSACSDNDVPDIPSNPAVQTYAASLNVNIAQMTRLSDNLFVQDLTVGTGAEAVVGSTVGVRYTGWLIDGRQFDGNVGRAPFTFALGIAQVIPGWDLGVLGMRVGGRRRLVIGSRLGYGREGTGPIPPNASLVFDVEVLSVR